VRPAKRFLSYVVCALAGAAAALTLGILGTVPAMDRLLERASETVVEYRSRKLLDTSALDESSATAHIVAASDCVGMSFPCTYATEIYIVDIEGGKGTLRVQRQFGADQVPAESVDSAMMHPCQLVSDPVPLSALDARRITGMLSLPHFFDFKSVGGGEPTDTNARHVTMTLNGRAVSVSILGPDSAPPRIRELVGLVHRLGKNRIHIADEWPAHQKCRL
jgi:hypothetical protein